jgi:hypothetical protein
MLRKVKLELARCHEFPEGSAEHGYELDVPLTATGKLDHDSWLKHRHVASFRRFWGDDEKRGELRHDRRSWYLSFAPASAEDEVIFRGDEHRFAVGEYLSIKEHDGITRTFRVASVH